MATKLRSRRTTWRSKQGSNLVTFGIWGTFGFRFLKSDKLEFHRLVRINLLLDSWGRRTYSFASVYATHEVDDTIWEIDINPADIELQHFQIWCAGGQNVNKVELRVQLDTQAYRICSSCRSNDLKLANRGQGMRNDEIFVCTNIRCWKAKLAGIVRIESSKTTCRLRNHKTETTCCKPYKLVKRTTAQVWNLRRTRSVLMGGLNEFMNSPT